MEQFWSSLGWFSVPKSAAHEADESVPSKLPKVMVYFPPELKAELERLSTQERRSMSAMVVYIVEKYIEQLKADGKFE